MNLCFFIGTPGGEGAVTNQFMALGKDLAEKGNRVVILIDGQRKEKERHSGNPLIYTWPSKRPVKFRDAYFLYRLIRKFQPDCLLANFGANNVMMLVGWLMRVPLRICWKHTLNAQIKMDSQYLWLKARYLHVRRSMIYKMTTNIVAVSKAARSDACKEFTLPPSKVKVFYNLLADPAKSVNFEMVPVKRENSIICVGRFFPSKGQDILVKAMAILGKEFHRLHAQFVGDGPTKNYCINLAKELNVTEKCAFVGQLSHNEVIQRMAESYVTVVPSHNEAFGYINIESMAVGTPVIASEVGGISEIVRDGIDGFLVPPDDPGALADKLKQLMANPELRNTMAREARQHFLERFELHKAVAKQVEWLASLAGKQR